MHSGARPAGHSVCAVRAPDCAAVGRSTRALGRQRERLAGCVLGVRVCHAVATQTSPQQHDQSRCIHVVWATTARGTDACSVSSALGHVLLWVVVPDRACALYALILSLALCRRRRTNVVSGACVSALAGCVHGLLGHPRLSGQGCEGALHWAKPGMESSTR